MSVEIASFFERYGHEQPYYMAIFNFFSIKIHVSFSHNLVSQLFFRCLSLQFQCFRHRLID